MAGKKTTKQADKTEIVESKPFNAELVKFDYTAEQIKELVSVAEETDLTDLEAVKEQFKVMQKIRTTISEQGLSARRYIKKFAQEVQDRENNYLDLAAPTEAKLKKVIDDDKEARIMEARKELLPMKRDQLDLLKHIREVSDDEILAMDDKQWVTFYQDMMATNSTEIQRIEDQKEADAKAEEDRKQAELDGIEKGKQEAKEAQERKEKEEAEAEEKRKEEEAQAQAELEENKKYKDFLAKNKFNPKTDKLFNVDGELSIYRFVAKAKIKIKK